MGIKELTKLIEPCGIIVSYEEYRNKYIAVDVFQKIYKYCIVNANSRENNSFDDRIYNKHLRAVINCINQLIKFDITPIFIFDGTSIVTKVKNKTETIVNNTITNKSKSETNYNKQPIFRITPQQIKDCEKLIKSMGIPFVRAPFEADSQCAALTLCDSLNIDTVITNDTDILVFGSKSMLRMLPLQIINMIRNLFKVFIDTKPNDTIEYSIIDICNNIDNQNSMKELEYKIDIRQKYKFEMIVKISDMESINFAVRYKMEDILKYLTEYANKILRQHNIDELAEFTKLNFIDICIIAGNDYLKRIVCVNIHELFKIFVLSQCNIDILIQNIKEKKFDLKNVHDNIDENYTKNVINIREYYLNASIIDPTTIDLTIYKPMEVDFYNLLNQNGFDDNYIFGNLQKYKLNYNKLLFTQMKQ